MSYPRAFKLGGLVAGVFSLLLIGFTGGSFGARCLPPTPNPCAADGVCRPKRDSWGHYKTNWRPWPGETVGQQPDEAGPEDVPTEDFLPPVELPKPEQEDLRGPAKDKKKPQRSSDAADEALPAAQLELLDDTDPFGPQGNNQPQQLPLVDPNMEDAPPALPASLRQAALLRNVAPLAQRQPTVANPPITALPPVRQPLQQANWQQPAIGLVNPASALVTDPEADSLQQAIYYEASDLDESQAVE